MSVSPLIFFSSSFNCFFNFTVVNPGKSNIYWIPSYFLFNQSNDVLFFPFKLLFHTLLVKVTLTCIKCGPYLMGRVFIYEMFTLYLQILCYGI